MDALVPDNLWAVIEPLLPFEPEKPKGGRRVPRIGRRWLASSWFCVRACSGSTCRVLRWAAAAKRVGGGSARGRQPVFGLPCTARCWSNFRTPMRSTGRARPSTVRACQRNVWPAPSASGLDPLVCAVCITYPAFRRAVSQDGDPRVLGLIKGSASSAIFAERLAEHRSTVRPSSSHRPQTSEGRRVHVGRTRIRQSRPPARRRARGAAAPRRCAPSWPPGRPPPY